MIAAPKTDNRVSPVTLNLSSAVGFQDSLELRKGFLTGDELAADGGHKGHAMHRIVNERHCAGTLNFLFLINGNKQQPRARRYKNLNVLDRVVLRSCRKVAALLHRLGNEGLYQRPCLIDVGAVDGANSQLHF